MKIGQPKRRDTQRTFWPKPITTMAETRNHCGDFGEELTATVSCGVRLKTDGTADYCPDIQHAEHQFSECKSVGKNGYAIVYEGRRVKDRLFVTGGEEGGMGERMLFYWFWHHKCAAVDSKDVDALRTDWARCLRFGVMLPFPTVDRLAETRRLKVLNRGTTRGGIVNNYGSLAKGYRDGRSLPMSLLKSGCDAQGFIGPVDIGGAVVVPTPVFFVSRFQFLIPTVYSVKDYDHARSHPAPNRVRDSGDGG